MQARARGSESRPREIAIAWLAHLHEQFRWDLLVYGAAVVFVAVHGPLTPEQWRRAVSGALPE